VQMKWLLTFLASLLVAACMSNSPREADYHHVAEKLVTLEPCPPQYCSGGWYPLDRAWIEDTDSAAAQVAVTECVEKLQQNLPTPRPHAPPNQPGLAAGRAPTEVIAAAQIVTCMREKGWLYSVEGTVVM